MSGFGANFGDLRIDEAREAEERMLTAAVGGSDNHRSSKSKVRDVVFQWGPPFPRWKKFNVVGILCRTKLDVVGC
ncbi:hypothetical protein PVK06_009654 [Gossypium arboreum]|uniref:Uncharacterized protein n=1 Tax=Gossypium arboreum TaxID=29729 RepID=A0ABR0QN41_GOSAR|nr:hypothetical protein PVK06_009654 [Gossypium arboreum]